MEWVQRTLTGGRSTFVRNVQCVSSVGAYIAWVGVNRLIRGTRREKIKALRQSPTSYQQKGVTESEYEGGK